MDEALMSSCNLFFDSPSCLWMRSLVERRAVVVRLVLITFALALITTLPASRAEAACSVPNQINNGQTADATAVMDNFNALKDCVNLNVSPSGTPVAGNLPVFSTTNTITSGNLSGDCSTSGTLSVVCTKTNGA